MRVRFCGNLARLTLAFQTLVLGAKWGTREPRELPRRGQAWALNAPFPAPDSTEGTGGHKKYLAPHQWKANSQCLMDLSGPQR
ncbi:hypothetical protein N657DRAFT_639345 [Parathielavia appendiculata]|uniref:Secreted protein n=1 Tax=Parathielavia appendiculata TaxID=2587402 RepID=A0AAN6U9B3_9PEZI|nr:hypothetical protein N657DRAFT_639345 [Parathielavia appendiculata]